MSARLFMLIFIVCASTLAGVLVIAVLTLGMVDARSILIGAGLGVVLALNDESANPNRQSRME